MNVIRLAWIFEDRRTCWRKVLWVIEDYLYCKRERWEKRHNGMHQS